MIPFARARTRRHIAATMLVFWLFAMASAWANACLLQVRAAHFDDSAVAGVQAPIVSPGHAGIAAGHAGKKSSGEAPCLKVCDEISQTTVKWQSDVGLNTLPMVPTAARAWAVSDALTDERRQDLSEHAAQASPPLRTLYMRLAL